MADKCLLRIEDLLKKSSIRSTQKNEILDAIKLAQQEMKVSKINEINVDKVAQEVTEQIKLQKKINKRNAIENEIKIRKLTEFVIKNFPDDPEEGLISILVGTNRRVAGARDSVAIHQQTSSNQLIAGFNRKLRENNLEELFADADKKTQERVAIAMEEINQRKTDIEKRTGLEPPITETNQSIKKLAEIMDEYSEMIRQSLNDRGANIAKMWGYIIRQTHDPYSVRDAANKLGLKDIEIDTKGKTKKNINYEKNYTAWRNFVMEKLDHDRTFVNVDDIEEFMTQVYSTLVGNKYQMADGTSFIFGTKITRNVAKKAEFKRVLHFKSASDWFAYNDIFGMGNLKESFISGLQTTGRNIGMLDSLGTRPTDNFNIIRAAVHERLRNQKKNIENIKSDRPFVKYLRIVDGSVYTVENFAVAKYSAIARSIASMAKLGGATISAAADIGLYGSEMRFQGRSFLGGMFEALNSLRKIKNPKQLKDIVESLGLITDSAIYDIAGRYQVGDNMSKGWTRTQRIFFKLNLLTWWTNTLKEGAMLGMANYFAKQKNVEFGSLNKQLKSLFETYNIDSTRWDIIRKTAMETADDGKEFINIGLLDQISDADIKRITGLDNLTQRQIRIEKTKFKTSVSGMLLDRTLYAVIEPDARVKGFMTQGTMSGTGPGEAIRFVGQFKAFPLSIVMKVLGREMDYFKGANKQKLRGTMGLGAILLTSSILGYMSMTIKDLLKGKEPRDPTKFKSFVAALLQGGGLGIYGDVLFRETRSSLEAAGSLAGPVPLSGLDVVLALKYGMTGEGGKAARLAYRAVTQNIPFLNLFYIKTAFDYLIGYQMLETLNPGILKRMEKRMKKDYNQDFLLTKPSRKFKGF